MSQSPAMARSGTGSEAFNCGSSGCGHPLPTRTCRQAPARASPLNATCTTFSTAHAMK